MEGGVGERFRFLVSFLSADTLWRFRCVRFGKVGDFLKRRCYWVILLLMVLRYEYKLLTAYRRQLRDRLTG